MVVVEPKDGSGVMDQLINGVRCCPACSSREYVFRGRKKIAATSEQPAAIETKYMCKACGHAWRERVVVKAR
jgi:hypothetical protein